MPKGIYTRTHRVKLDGQRFGKLYVLSEDGQIGRQYTYRCLCDCGKIREKVNQDGLRRGKTKSCGCDYPMGAKGYNLSKDEYYEHSKKRLLDKMKIVNDCWIWQGKTNNKGYGHIYWGQGSEKKKQPVHRISYRLWKGEIPDKLCVLHSCDNPLCFNPDHLSLGTQLENIKQASERKRWNPALGSRCGNSKLKEEDIKEIRKMRSEHKTLEEIAFMYNISPENVCSICKGHTWRHVL